MSGTLVVLVSYRRYKFPPHLIYLVLAIKNRNLSGSSCNILHLKIELRKKKSTIEVLIQKENLPKKVGNTINNSDESSPILKFLEPI